MLVDHISIRLRRIRIILQDLKLRGIVSDDVYLTCRSLVDDSTSSAHDKPSEQQQAICVTLHQEIANQLGEYPSAQRIFESSLYPLEPPNRT